MENEIKITGWIAVDSDTFDRRRASLFSRKPVRDLLTDLHYWAATAPYYESIQLDSNAFPEIKWEDEPVEAEITIKLKN